MRSLSLVLLSLLLGGCATTGGGASDGAPMSDAPMPSTAPSEAPASEPPMRSPETTAGPSEPAPSPSAAAFDDPLLSMTLVDVRSGEPFTLAELAAERPVLVEMMAIWCTTCRGQMHEITAAHDLADFATVGIDVDASEIAEDLAAYVDEEGFDWPFAMADASLATHLRERFGNQALFPPNTPKLLVGTDGSVVLLPLGQVLSPDEIAALVSG